MVRSKIPSYFFTIVVVRKGHRFLVVEEKGGEWYFPGGGVLVKESLFEAAQRETLEESGIKIFIDGIYQIEHIANPDDTTRCRVIFTARPIDDTPPKEVADEETLSASWKTLEEIEKLPLRSNEVVKVLRDIHNGAPIYPKNLLLSERLSVR